MGLRGWLNRRLGVDDARESEAKTKRIAKELHDVITETRAEARARAASLGQQDWERLYQERRADRVVP